MVGGTHLVGLYWGPGRGVGDEKGQRSVVGGGELGKGRGRAALNMQVSMCTAK
jgi:hypothetical protein